MDLGDMLNNYEKKEIVDAVKEYNSKKPAKDYQEKKAEAK